MVVGCNGGTDYLFFYLNLQTKTLTNTNITVLSGDKTCISTYEENNENFGRILIGQYNSESFLNESLPKTGVPLVGWGKRVLSIQFAGSLDSAVTVVTPDDRDS